MAPRTSKSKNDDASTTSSDAVLKPKTEKAKVSKVKADKSAGAKTAAAAVKGKAAAASEKKVEKVEKVKAVTGDAAVQLIVEYLKAQNRPFSATEVSANLHGKVSGQCLITLFLSCSFSFQFWGERLDIGSCVGDDMVEC
jgi:26S proteasome regulatory subunit (ATPase 3-interacting protein)